MLEGDDSHDWTSVNEFQNGSVKPELGKGFG